MQTVIGLFDNANDAQRAVQQLKTMGFTNENVDLSMRSGSSDTSGSYSTDDTENPTSGTSNYTTDTDEDTVTGSARQTSWDTTRDGDHDSFGDKVTRFFKNLFGDNDDDANRYSHVANKAGAVVTVHAQSDEESERAADILDEYGAVDVDERATEYGYSGYNRDTTTGKMNTDTNTDTDESSKTLSVIKEDVQVGKREVETGGVRLRSRIVERPVEENVRLREEKVTVERTPVDRAATTSDLKNFKEGEIEMTERSEIADIAKNARVVEEVKLSKEVNERTETVRETARDTEVDVENLKKDDFSGKTNKNRDL